jgi:acyl-CoA thioester hydrolase
MPPASRPFTHRFEVRFPEVDSYGVVWHGHYVAYLELARNAFCAAGGLSPAETLAAGYKAPITRVELSLKRSARLEETLEVRATMRPSAVAKLTVDYEIRRVGSGGAATELLGTGLTEQVILNPDGELLLTLPAPVKELVARMLAFHRGERELPAEKIVLPLRTPS